MPVFSTPEAIEKLQEVNNLRFSDEQLEVLKNKGGTQIVACAGSGKALAEYELVCTPMGLVPIGELKVGDKVYTPDGKITEIDGVYPQGRKDAYRVYFNNVVHIDCSLDHLWSYRLSGYDVVASTKTMIGYLNKGKKLYVERCKPIDFGGKDYNQTTGQVIKELERLSFYDIDFKFDNNILYSSVTYRKKLIDHLVLSHGSYYNNEYTILFGNKSSAYFIGLVAQSLGFVIVIETIEINKKPWYKLRLARNRDSDLSDTYCWENDNSNYWRVTSIKKLNKRPKMVCIHVKDSGHEFVTGQFIRTHNTTLLVNLVTKRIMTGEIKDPSKLLMTTYSKAGADEMSARINKLLSSVGIQSNVSVKTMHSTYYNCASFLGMVKPIVSNAQRRMFIRQSVKDIKLNLEESDIETLDNLISYQINNMLTDEELYNNYMFSVDITLNEYSNIRMGYGDKKKQAGLIDFDDLQYIMYYYLCIAKYQPLIDYCKKNWSYFYVDEFQDTSKIQFKILKAFVSDANNLMVIGDDDQCLVDGTLVETPSGEVPIESLKMGDSVYSLSSDSGLNIGIVSRVSSKDYDGTVIKIKTSNGRELRGTPDHIGFAYSSSDKDQNQGKYIAFNSLGEQFICDYEQLKESKNWDRAFKIVGDYPTDYYRQIYDFPDLFNNREAELVFSGQTSSLGFNNKMVVKSNLYDCEHIANVMGVNIKRSAILGEIKYSFIPLGRMEKDMIIPTSDGPSKIVSIEREHYKGKVYDIDVSTYHNFIADGICTHNCIYSWRGADPSIILNIGAYYDLKKCYLSTNYRCRENIVDFASAGVNKMYTREPKNMKSNAQGGKIQFISANCKDLYGMTCKAACYIKNRIANGALPEEIAVLVRNNQHAAILGNILMNKYGIYYSAPAEMQLSKLKYFKDMESLIALMGTSYNPQCNNQSVVRSILWKIVKFIGTKGTEFVISIMSNTGAGLTTALEILLRDIIERPGVYENTRAKIPEQVEFKLKHQASRLKEETVNDLYALYNILKMTDRDKKMLLLLEYYKNGLAFTIKDLDTKRIFNCFMGYIYSLYNSAGMSGIEQMIARTKQYESGNGVVLGGKVRLSTIHSAKGLEWKEVIILAYDNIAFPSFTSIVALRDTNKLSYQDLGKYIDEERRLSYVGLTRAIDTLTIITDFSNMSIFGLEALGINFDSSPYNIYYTAKNYVYNQRFNYGISEDDVIKLGYSVVGSDNTTSSTEES